jgi:predicted ATPase
MHPVQTGHGQSRGVDAPTVRVANFKSIASGEVTPTPLTILTGANSSGKSSLLQSILLLSQSMQSDDVVLNGDLVKLGEPRDVIRDGTDSLWYEFSFPATVVIGDGETQTNTYSFRLGFAVDDDRLRIDRALLTENDAVVLEADYDAKVQKPLTQDAREVFLRVHEPEQYELPPETLLSFVGFRPSRLVYKAKRERLRQEFDALAEAALEGDFGALSDLLRLIDMPSPVIERSGDRPSPDTLAEKLRRSYATRFQRGPSPVPPLTLDPSELDRLYAAYLQAEAPNNWISEIIGGTGQFARPRRASAYRRMTPPVPDQRPLEAFEWVSRAVERVSRLADSIRYLGPLRDDPRVVYALGHTVSALPVGDKGEFTAGFLAQHGTQHGWYFDSEKRRKWEQLAAAVAHWCAYLTIGENVAVPSQGKLGYGFTLTINGVDRDLTDIGVGASQLLPVVVVVLGAPPGATVLLEQPELHLHPAVQSRLADFFAVARPDVQLLIETHSEYILTRLRLRIAQEQLTASNIAVLFAEQRSGETRFDRLWFNEYGDFDRWPAGFFDAIGDDNVALARALQARFAGPSASSAGS